MKLLGVSRRYGDQGQWFAVRDAELTISEGDFVAIVGPSGSGKSTLLNILGLLDNAWEGEFEFQGASVRSLNQQSRDELRSSTIGFVFQSSYANPYESTARNAALGLAIAGVPLAEQSNIVHGALRTVGLELKGNSLARNLSGGERQRLAIARAIATSPKIILADEPTGNLDTRTARSVMELLRKLNESGTTVVVITHDPLVAAYAGRTIEVEDGIVVDSAGSFEPQLPAHRSFDRPRLQNQRFPRRSRSEVRSGRVFRAVNNVASRPLRSATLVAAFTVAIAGVVASAGISASASQQIADRLAAAALDEVQVFLPSTITGSEREASIDRISELPRVLGVGEVSTLDAATAQVSRNPTSGLAGTTFAGVSVAADEAALNIYGVETLPEEALNLFGRPDAGNVALVGRNVAAGLGIGEDLFGAEIWVSGEPYEVIGIIADANREQNLVSGVLVPVGQSEGISSQLVVRTEVGSSASVAEAIPLALSPGAPADIAVSTAGDLRNIRIGVAEDLDDLLASISLALLGIAILSASSAMFLSIQTRIQELALSRALGLSRIGVATVFIHEGIIVGLAGSLAGIALGLSGAVMVAAVQGWTATIPWSTVAVTPVIGILSGAVSAFFPALRASRIDPADAIR